MKKKLLLAAKLLLSAGAVYFVLRKTDLARVSVLIKSCNWALLMLAFILLTTSKYLSAVRLNLFLKSIRIDLSESLNLKLYLLGMYYNLFLPGGIGGDGYKVYILHKYFHVKQTRIAKAILFDRVSGLIALFCLLLGLMYLVPEVSRYKMVFWLSIPLSLVVFKFVTDRFLATFKAVYTRSNVLAFGVQVLQVVGVACLIFSIGETNNILQYLLVFLASSIVAVIPFTIGGAGAREITFLYGANFLFLNPTVSVTISLLFFLLSSVLSLTGIVYSFGNLFETNKLIGEYA